MKDLAKFCMSKHEAEVRSLAQTQLGGRRFEQFIAWWQWEMLQQNKDPIPEESKSSDKYVASAKMVFIQKD